MENSTLILQKDFKHASVSTVDSKPSIAVVTAKTGYIPIEEFKKIFESIGDLVKANRVNKLIFDKRNLTVFHQPSMEWYFIEWKAQMFELGLKTHRKLLPNNEVFRQSVKIGRDKINAAHPGGTFHKMDIGYAETLEEAINK